MIKISRGIGRKIDRMGRIVIPREMRKTLNFKEGQKVNIELNNDTIIITKCKSECLFCNRSYDLKKYKNYSIFKNCLEKIKNID